MKAKFKELDIISYEGCIYELTNGGCFDKGGDGYEPGYWYYIDYLSNSYSEGELTLVCHAKDRKDRDEAPNSSG